MEEFGMTAHYWDGDAKKIVGRRWSRKYNGHSVIWDGGVSRGKRADQFSFYYKGNDKGVIATGLWSLGRGGKVKVINAPDFWLDRLPPFPAHGELWMNDNLQYIKKYCKCKSINSAYWMPVKFKIFYIKPYCTFPLPEMANSPYYKNDLCQGAYLDMAKHDFKENTTAQFVEHFPMNSLPQVLETIHKFYETNWEGMMFFDPQAHYEGKRSYCCLKFKPTYEDEAEITGYEEGKTGKRIGKVAAIKVKYVINDKFARVCGYKESMKGQTVEFSVSGLNDAEVEWDHIKEKYPVGSIIKFGFKMFSENGIPQSSNVYRGM